MFVEGFVGTSSFRVFGGGMSTKMSVVWVECLV